MGIEHESRPRPCLGFREREPGRLQLRVGLFDGEGVCDVELQETDELVAVELFVCGDATDRTHICDCPVHVYLDKPLDERPVIDLTTGRTVTERQARRN
jgi:hypothetical protein